MRKSPSKTYGIIKTPEGNLQLPNGSWVNTNILSNDDYKEALRIGIANMIHMGRLDYDKIKGQPSEIGLL